ncbi:hypothetical protein BaRGS_00030007 [Batillaria attramentaria]|uniref:C1q domain-containing protein n=1 Tax=Batillaria attramentaria TaxID=370345 RepID=A0ABD0JVR9_9CAEN
MIAHPALSCSPEDLLRLPELTLTVQCVFTVPFIFFFHEERQVAFMVDFHTNSEGHDYAMNISKTGPIVFDHVQSNYGHGYSTSTGKFIVPYPGLYWFRVHFMSTYNGEGTIGIFSNAITGHGFGCYAYAEDLNVDSNDQASCDLVMHFRTGDEVYVKYHFGEPYIWTGWSNFLGALITPD